MKKFLAIFILFVTASSVVWAEDTEKKIIESIYPKLFTFRLQRCIPYSGSVSTDDAKVSRKIEGWKDSVCRYTETVVTEEASLTVNCNLSRSDLDTLVKTMKSDEPKIKVKKNGFSYKSASSDALWDSYRNNVSVCKPKL